MFRYISVNGLKDIVVTDIWVEFLKIAKEEAGSRVVETWFKAVCLHQWDPHEKIVHLQAPNAFVQDWIKVQLYSFDRTSFEAIIECGSVARSFCGSNSCS